MKGWETCELGDVLTFQRGFDLPNQQRVHGEYPIVSSNGISDYHNEFKIKGPGIVTGRYGTIGEVFYIRDNFWPLNTSLFVKDFKGNDIRFLSYLLKTINIKGLNAAGAVPGVNRNHLHKIKIRIPPLPTQRRIASILSAYDDLIENNLKRIKLLEELAQRTYEEWFVRMKFPGHENTPINAETGLPEGWEKKKLGDIANLTMGQSPKSEFYNFEKVGLPFHQGVKDYGTRYPENSTWSASGNRFAFENDILFSVRAPVGRLNIALEKIILGRGLAAISHKTGHTSFLFYQLQKIFFKEDLLGGGAIFNSVTKADMERIEIIEPHNKCLAEFNDFASNIDQQIKKLTIQNRLLKESRDILLPRLMGGKIGVEEAEVQMNAAAEPEVNYKKN